MFYKGFLVPSVFKYTLNIYELSIDLSLYLKLISNNTFSQQLLNTSDKRESQKKNRTISNLRIIIKIKSQHTRKFQVVKITEIVIFFFKLSVKMR